MKACEADMPARPTDTQTRTDTDTNTDTNTDGRTDDRPTGRQPDRLADRQTDRDGRTDGQTGRPASKYHTSPASKSKETDPAYKGAWAGHVIIPQHVNVMGTGGSLDPGGGRPHFQGFRAGRKKATA